MNFASCLGIRLKLVPESKFIIRLWLDFLYTTTKGTRDDTAYERFMIQGELR